MKRIEIRPKIVKAILQEYPHLCESDVYELFKVGHVERFLTNSIDHGAQAFFEAAEEWGLFYRLSNKGKLLLVVPTKYALSYNVDTRIVFEPDDEGLYLLIHEEL